MIHKEKSPLAGKTVKVKDFSINGAERKNISIKIEDWYDRLNRKSWRDSYGNPACLHYAIISGIQGLPNDDEVLYGQLEGFGIGMIVHISELEVD